MDDPENDKNRKTQEYGIGIVRSFSEFRFSGFCGNRAGTEFVVTIKSRDMNPSVSRMQYLAPFLLMLFLYFIVGLFTVINQQLQVPLQSAMFPRGGHFANALVTLLNFSWFLAYPAAQGTGARWIDRYGYKRTSVYAFGVFLGGLLIYELAVLMHIHFPSSFTLFGDEVSAGFFVFLLGSFLVGSAVTIIQVVTNLYLSVSPVGRTTVLQRQMIGGTVNSLGMALGPLAVSYLLFRGIPLHRVTSGEFLFPVFGLMIAVAVMAWITGRVRMGDVCAVKRASVTEDDEPEASVWSFPQLKRGVWAIFFYVGVEVAVGANINLYAVGLDSRYGDAATHMAALYWAGLLVGRLIGSFFGKVPPQRQLLGASVGAAALLVLTMVFGDPWILAGVGFFHSVMWPAIVTLAVKGLGEYTIRASGALMIGVVGGGVLPFLQGVLADAFHGDWRWTWVLVVLGEAYIFYYGLNGYRVRKTAEA